MDKEYEISIEIISQKVIHYDGYESPIRHGVSGFVLDAIDNIHHDQLPIKFFLEPFIGLFDGRNNIKDDWFGLLMILFVYVMCSSMFLGGVCLITLGIMFHQLCNIILGFFMVGVFHFLFNVILFDPNEIQYNPNFPDE